MLRLILILIILIAYLVLFLPIMLILLIWRKFDKRGSSRVAQAMVATVFKLMMLVSGAKVELRGMENIPKDEAVLFVSNHKGFFDIVAGYAYTPKLLGFVAKEEMKAVPILNIWMVLVNCLFLDRKDIKKGLKTILDGISNVKEGYSVWICPEGTRNKSEDETNLLEFKEGSLKIAQKSRCFVVPVAITGTRQILEAHMPLIKKSHVTIEYGKAFKIAELDEENKKRPGSFTRDIIYSMLVNKDK